MRCRLGLIERERERERFIRSDKGFKTGVFPPEGKVKGSLLIG